MQGRNSPAVFGHLYLVCLLWQHILPFCSEGMKTYIDLVVWMKNGDWMYLTAHLVQRGIVKHKITHTPMARINGTCEWENMLPRPPRWPYFHPLLVSHSPCSERRLLAPGPTPRTPLWTAGSFLSRQGTSAPRVCFWKCSHRLTCHASAHQPAPPGEKYSQGGHLIKTNTYSQPPSSISNVAKHGIFRRNLN